MIIFRGRLMIMCGVLKVTCTKPYRSGPSPSPADFYLHEFPWQAIWNTKRSHIRLGGNAKIGHCFFLRGMQ